MSVVTPVYLRQTFQDKSLIFASVAEESLDNSLYVVWRRAVHLLSTRSSFVNYFSNCFTEIYFIGHLFIQLSCLRQFGATFSEHFFGLKRTSLKNEGSPRLSDKEILLSLLFSCIARYVREKLRQANQNSEKKSLMRLNAFCNVTNFVASTVQFIRFLSGNSDVVTPYHLAAGVKLEYRNEATSPAGNTLKELLSRALENSLGVSAFLLQFLQWWQTERNTTADRINVPAPAAKKEKDAGRICFLCNSEMTDMTLLSCSGHVFCYKCISSYVEKFKKCPITNVPAELSKLIQLQK